MKKHNVAEYCKNAVGTMFLLAGAFFVCSTLLSMRSVLADPIAPVVNNNNNGAQSPRSATSPRRGLANTVSRATTTRAATTRASSAGRVNTAGATRGVVSRAQQGTKKPTTIRSISLRSLQAGRAVSSRANANRTNNAAQRTVRARSAVTPTTSAKAAGDVARVSLTGSAIRGSSSKNSNYTYLSNKLYQGNYSNIIDSTTGLISADAYSNCMESYYTCMDEICTARNASQGRCACAARTKAFQSAENALEEANEELIKVSGELALLIATKGKDVSAAFQLTDAEKIMNCASYTEIVGTGTDAEIEKWCSEHIEYSSTSGNISTSTCNKSTAPTYCTDMSNTYGFDLAALGGSGSDILASLRAWADAKDAAKEIILEDNTNLLEQYTGVMNIVSGLTNTSAADETSLDALANTWGYELFEYAHNNVCSRVLDSCFNGIYEGCGTPPSGGRCVNSATASCPFNYNSKITVASDGDVVLNERGKGSATAASSATCFGYTSSTGDPYSSLRGPVADARRSVMQKYLLDANAACDAYGEQLRNTAQNIGYQKVAAQQALQQKRMEFANEERETILNDAITAGTNFDLCISEIYDCYETQYESNDNWPEARIKTYCAQIANVPHCYETMICNPSNAVFKAVIDKPDSATCNNSSDYTVNNCRNIVTLNDILNGTGATGEAVAVCDIDDTKCNSAGMRQECLLKAIGETNAATGQHAIQTWFDDVKASEKAE